MNDIRIDTAKDQIAEKAWKSLLDESPCASFFQSPACYDFYAGLSFLEPFVLAVEESGRLTGLVCGYIIRDGGWLKSFFSRRAIVPGGALLAADISAEALEQLLKALRQYLKRKAIYAEFRNYTDYQAFREVFEKTGFSYSKHYNIRNQLRDKTLLTKNLSDSLKRQLRQSVAQGLASELTTDTEDIQEFYGILSELYRSRIGKPFFPVEFFEKIVREPFAQLRVIRHNGTIEGGILTVEFEHRSVSEWFVCGHDGGHKTYPSALATWSAMEDAAERQFDFFDFMGAGSDTENQGVRTFKSRFGGELTETGRFIFVFNPYLYRLGALYIQWKKKK